MPDSPVANEPLNLRELLEMRTTVHGTEPFITSAATGEVYSYLEFDAAVNRTANLLRAHNIKKGDVVSLLLPNSVAYVVAYFACFKLGALAGPVNSLLKEHELEYVLAHSEAKALLVSSELAGPIAGLRVRLPMLATVIEFDDVTEATKGRSAMLAADAITLLEPGDEAIIIYTSGTTGKPKGCLLTHENLLANARQIANWMKFTSADRLLTVMPLFHMNAVAVTTLTPMYAGAATVVAARFSASRFWQMISEHGITSFGSVATMLSMLLKTYPDGVPAGAQTKQLRFAMCGSAPVPIEVMRLFEDRFNCLVIEGYGLSESTCRSTFNPPDIRRRPGSCGLPIGNEMKIVDDEDNEVQVGALGEIVMRGANMLKGYFKNQEATEQAFRDGWFHSGDIGYRDADGFYFIVDRKSDMIIRAGENIYPREIDEVLYQHAAVQAAAVIGVPDAVYGEEVAAFVIASPDFPVTEAELIDFCRERLADYKCPKSVRFVTEIPKGPTGKLLKRELTRLVQ